jgi:hypothetical protein
MNARAILVAIVLVMAWGLVACGTLDARITLYQNQAWQAEIRMTLNAQETDQVGAMVEGELSKQAARWKSQNVRYEWRKEKDGNNTVYVITTEGKGWASLSQVVFDGKARIESTDRGVRLVLRDTGVISTRATTLRLTGGQIVSSNADEVKGNTAIWYNVQPGRTVEAVLTEASRSPLPVPCPGGTMVALLLPLGYYLHRRTH